VQVVQPPPPSHAIQAVQQTVKPVFHPNNAPVPRATVPDQAFSAAHIISGARQPDYPDQYNDSGRNGRVTVDCVIQTNGHPTNCHVVSQQGGAAFAASVMQWLNGSNPPVYRPAIRGGQPQAEEHQWVVSFQAPE
jgi:TonB family protein